MHKPKLILLSDLWGGPQQAWMEPYVTCLSEHFLLAYYDCCELGDVDISDYRQASLHHQFTQHGGLKRAVEQLISLERAPVHVLGFSIGGVVGWQFAVSSKLVTSLTCVSSTRLRYEDQRPSGPINLFFGADDPYLPTAAWFSKMKVRSVLIETCDHDLYKTKAAELSAKLKWLLKPNKQ